MCTCFCLCFLLLLLFQSQEYNTVSSTASFYTLLFSITIHIHDIIISIQFITCLFKRFKNNFSYESTRLCAWLKYFISHDHCTFVFHFLPVHYLNCCTTFIPFTIRLLCAPKAKKICWKDKIKYNKYILQTGISLVISTVSMTIYSRINQFSVSFIEGSYDLGVYSVALTLGTAWGFVGNAVAISFLSKIYAETDDHKAMEITAGLSLGIIFLLIMFPCVFIFIGPWVIQILYGNDYSAAYPVAVILCFSTIISTLGFVSNRFIVRFSGYNYLSKKTMVILFISIPLSSLFTYCWRWLVLHTV